MCENSPATLQFLVTFIRQSWAYRLDSVYHKWMQILYMLHKCFPSILSSTARNSALHTYLMTVMHCVTPKISFLSNLILHCISYDYETVMEKRQRQSCWAQLLRLFWGAEGWEQHYCLEVVRDESMKCDDKTVYAGTITPFPSEFSA